MGDFEQAGMTVVVSGNLVSTERLGRERIEEEARRAGDIAREVGKERRWRVARQIPARHCCMLILEYRSRIVLPSHGVAED